MYIDKSIFNSIKQQLFDLNSALFNVSSQFLKIEMDENEKAEFDRQQPKGKLTFFPGVKNTDTALSLNQNENKGESEKMPYLKEGTIRHKKDGRYEIRYYDINKKRKSIYAKTQKECVRKLNIALELKKNGIAHNMTPINKPEPIIEEVTFTLYTWLQFWYDNFKAPNGFNISKSQLTSIEICIRKHIKENIADKDIKKLTSLNIQQALNKIKSSKMRKETRNVYSDALRTAFNQKIINENPMNAVLGVIHNSVNGVALSLQEQKDFCKKIPNTVCGNYFKFILLSGARPGEARNVQWSHVDFTNKTIIIPGTKTKKSNRILPLFTPLENLLLSISHTDEKEIFKVKTEEAENTFKKICPNHRLYDLRHTFVTRCLENTIPMKVIQIWVGHAKYSTTANIYSHVLDTFSVQEGNKISAIFDPYFDPHS